MIKILNVEPENYSDEARKVLRSVGELVEQTYSRAELLQHLSSFDVLIVRLGFCVDREILDAGTALKVIVSAATGLDHIDVSYAQSKKIEVLSLKGEHEFLRSIPATAEHTWALLLALLRNIPAAINSVSDGEWNRDLFRGHDITQKRLGLVGLGRIGEKVARYGLAFEMDVAAYDPYRISWLPEVTRYQTLSDLLLRTDILSIHVPLDASTTQLIGRREFSLLPPGAWLVNTSRGNIIDETALVDSLEGHHLQGAALDVIIGEQSSVNLANSPVIRYTQSHRNLIITPHIGGATYESMAMTEVFMARKLLLYLKNIGIITSLMQSH